ncbi:MAG: MarR family transcriptional regulator [Limnobacter sp.]|nr:MarR family transcriptional regulator [Limnobacter sp.]
MKKTSQQLRMDSWFAVVRAYQTCAGQFEVLMKECGLTSVQYEALAVIQHLGGKARLSDMAARLSVTKGNTTSLARRLEQAGLVSISAGTEDRRTQWLMLTNRGTRLFGRAQKAAGRFIASQLEPFSDDQCLQVHDYMQHMTSHLKTMNPVALAAGSKTNEKEV